MRFQGRVVEWNDERGFGYVVTHGDQQRIFLHIKQFAGARLRRPKVGDVLTYGVVPGVRGRPMADAVAFVTTRPMRRTAESAPKPLLLPGWCLALFFFVLAAMAWQQRVPWSVLACYFVMSVVTYLVYWGDKRAAMVGRWRTPESTLQLMALLCGWPGAWLAQRWLRHKTSKRSFQRVFWLAVVCNVAGLLLLAPRLGALP
jgi:uncharacterized membrane protein YsdA (DUF1294 family)/cold shock CspA family protein